MELCVNVNIRKHFSVKLHNDWSFHHHVLFFNDNDKSTVMLSGTRPAPLLTSILCWIHRNKKKKPCSPKKYAFWCNICLMFCKKSCQIWDCICLIFQINVQYTLITHNIQVYNVKHKFNTNFIGHQCTVLWTNASYWITNAPHNIGTWSLFNQSLRRMNFFHKNADC